MVLLFQSVGQNFLINPSVCPALPRWAEPTGFGVLEIGLGIGVLTAELAKRADKVVGIEIDSRLLPVLQETLEEFDNVRIIHGDVLKVDLHRVIQEEFAGMEVAVCANLPYYITSPILMSLLEQRLPIRSITVMVQREAGPAHLRAARYPGSRGGEHCCAVLQSAQNPVSGFQRQLYACARGGFLCDTSGCPCGARGAGAG